VSSFEGRISLLGPESPISVNDGVAPRECGFKKAFPRWVYLGLKVRLIKEMGG
jgi:hypothetical protein